MVESSDLVVPRDPRRKNEHNDAFKPLVTIEKSDTNYVKELEEPRKAAEPEIQTNLIEKDLSSDLSHSEDTNIEEPYEPSDPIVAVEVRDPRKRNRSGEDHPKLEEKKNPAIGDKFNENQLQLEESKGPRKTLNQTSDPKPKKSHRKSTDSKKDTLDETRRAIEEMMKGNFVPDVPLDAETTTVANENTDLPLVEEEKRQDDRHELTSEGNNLSNAPTIPKIPDISAITAQLESQVSDPNSFWDSIKQAKQNIEELSKQDDDKNSNVGGEVQKEQKSGRWSSNSRSRSSSRNRSKRMRSRSRSSSRKRSRRSRSRDKKRSYSRERRGKRSRSRDNYSRRDRRSDSRSRRRDRSRSRDRHQRRSRSRSSRRQRSNSRDNRRNSVRYDSTKYGRRDHSNERQSERHYSQQMSRSLSKEQDLFARREDLDNRSENREYSTPQHEDRAVYDTNNSSRKVDRHRRTSGDMLMFTNQENPHFNEPPPLAIPKSLPPPLASLNIPPPEFGSSKDILSPNMRTSNSESDAQSEMNAMFNSRGRPPPSHPLMQVQALAGGGGGAGLPIPAHLQGPPPRSPGGPLRSPHLQGPGPGFGTPKQVTFAI